MKKFNVFFLCLILTFLSLFSCFADTYVKDWSTPLTINGFVSKKQTLNVTPGSSFDITAEDVKYSASGAGKVVATWNLTTNMSSVTIKVTASPMANDLNYRIRLYYEYPKYTSAGESNGSKTGYVETNSTVTDGTTETLTNETDNELFPISFSSAQNITFMFLDGFDPSSNTYPAGDYSASVTIEIVEE